MKAIRVTEPGPPEVLRLEEVPEPETGPEDLRVEIRAAALNRADLMQRAGRYPAPPGVPPDIPGLEFAGVVAEVGARAASTVEAAGFRPPEVGDRVMGLLGGGGYAEQVSLPAGMALPVPEGLSLVEAAAIPEVFFTAYDALFRQADLSAGERVLVHSAGGGVGTAALQLARVTGAARIFGTASRAKLEGIAAAGLPLDVGVDYRNESFTEAVAGATGGRGVDVILDTVGADYWDDNVECLATRGRLLLVGLLGGARTEVDLSKLMRKRIRVYGTVLRARSRAEKLALTAEFRSRVLPLLEARRLRPVVDRTFPLEEAVEAHRYMAENRNLGKIILEVGG